MEEEELEKCYHAIRLMDASHATMLNPFPSKEVAFEWLREHINHPHVYVDGALRKVENQKEVFGKPPQPSIAELKRRKR